MHPQVKHARFNLVVCALAVLLTVAAYLSISVLAGPHQARGAFGFLGLLGFVAFGRIFYRKETAESGVVLDERDNQIRDRSQVIAWRVVWLYWVLMCMGPWLWIVLRSGLAAVETPFISVEWLPWVLMTAFLVFTTAWSISILVNYRTRGLTQDE